MRFVVVPDPLAPAATPVKTRSSDVVPQKPRSLQRLAAWLIFFLERLLIRTLRVSWDDRAGIVSGLPGPAIFCLWHNRLALCMCCWRDYISRHSPAKGLVALISPSKDGAFLACALERFGVRPVRGSTSARGSQALRELTSWLEHGYHLGLTPDGPRGPRYRVQPGVAALAQVTGAPVVPISYRARRRFTLRSWDQFQIPLPFSRCEIVFGEPLYFPRTSSEEGRESQRRQVEEALAAITHD